MNEIPPSEPADSLPQIHNDRDLYECWRIMLGELGFTERTLWVAFILPDGTVIPHVVQVAEAPQFPSVEDITALYAMCTRELAYFGSEASIALLLTRPGADVVTDSDRAWGVSMANASRTTGIRTHPLHLASDKALRVLAPDDLIGAA